MSRKERRRELLHVHKDCIWTLSLRGIPANTALDAITFARRQAPSDCGVFGLLGCAVNTGLILALDSQRRLGNIDRVDVATPLICKTARERKDPATAMLALRTCTRAPSQGGFHAFDDDDYPSYALSLTVKSTSPELADFQKQLLQRHPAYQALTFIRFIDWGRCAQLLSIIRDPRWYIDPLHPDRLAKLYMYLGLTPRVQRGVSLAAEKPRRYHNHCEAVLRTWKPRALESLLAVQRTLHTQPISFIDNPMPGEGPGDFLWRYWSFHRGRRAARGMSEQEQLVYADLRTSQRFVAYLRDNWLSAIYNGSRAMPDARIFGRGCLFRASDFFTSAEEAGAYSIHIGNSKAG